MCRLILIRHEMSVGNLTHTFAGKEVKLATIGKLRTKNTRREFNKLKLKNPIFIASEYKRAQETAKYVLHKKDYEKLRVTKYVNEIDFGDLVGRTFKENIEHYGESLNEWMLGPDRTAPPSGESFQNAFKRVKIFLDKIKDYEGDIVVFTHEGFIQLVLGYENRKIKTQKIKNGEIKIVNRM